MLPASWTRCLNPAQLGTSCLLSASLSWSNNIETFQDIIWESKINPGELICQSLRSTQPVRGPCSSVCAEPTQPCAASPGHRGCPARSGEPSASPSSHAAHTPPCPGSTKAALPNSVVIASCRKPQGSYTKWINHIKAGLCKKSNLFPLIMQLVTMRRKHQHYTFYEEKCFTPEKCKTDTPSLLQLCSCCPLSP